MDGLGAGIVLLDLFGLLVSFFSLCIVCDEHLVPAVEVIITQFKVPEEIAAVTLIAFGSAAPELFLNSVSAVAHTSDLSMSAILGSGIIAFGLIPSLCIVLGSTQLSVKLKTLPLIRETFFYIIGLIIFMSAIHDDQIGTYEALSITAVYLLYAAVVVTMYLRSIRKTASLDDASSELEFPSGAQKHIVGDEHDCDFTALPTDEPTTLVSSVSPRGAIGTDSLLSRSRSAGSRSDGGSEATIKQVAKSLSNETLITQRDDFEASRRSPSAKRTRSHSPLATHARHRVKVGSGTNSKENLHSFEYDSVEKISSPPRSGFSADAMEKGNYAVDCNCDINHHSRQLVIDTEGLECGEDIEEPGPAHEAKSCPHLTMHRLVHFIYYPLERLFWCVLPPLHPEIPLFITGIHPHHSSQQHEFSPRTATAHVSLLRIVAILVCCIICIGLLDSLIISCCEAMLAHLNVGTTTLGATLVAIGSEVPDVVSAVAMARNGFFDGAIAGAIGSQVIDISLGVGMPALMVCIFGNGYLGIDAPQADSLWILTCLLFVVISSYIIVIFPLRRLMEQREAIEFTIVTKRGASMQMMMWVAVYAIYFYIKHTENLQQTMDTGSNVGNGIS